MAVYHITVERTDGEYVLRDRDGDVLARAGALNVNGIRVGWQSETAVEFSEEMDVWVVDEAHADGVAFIATSD